MHVGQTAIDSIVSHGELFVIDSQLMEDGGMNIVYGRIVAAILGLESPLIAFTIGARFQAAAAHPVCEGKGIVVPT